LLDDRHRPLVIIFAESQIDRGAFLDSIMPIPQMRKTQLRELVSAGGAAEPGSHPEGPRRSGVDDPRRYGQTETTAQIGNTPGQALKGGSMGRPLPGYRVGVMDADGHEAAEGEICLYGGSERPAGDTELIRVPAPGDGGDDIGRGAAVS
jgi:hypothetical protein